MTATRIEALDLARDIRETSFGYRKRLGFILQQLERERARLGRPLRILDVGCGTGSLITHPLARLEDRVIGLDVHLPSLQRAHELQPAGASFLCGTPDALRTHSFDVVICSEVLEHVHEPGVLLAQVATALQPGGLCLATVPNGNGPYEWSQRVLHVTRPWLNRIGRMVEEPPDPTLTYESLNFSNEHIWFYGLGDLHRLFAAAGFGIEAQVGRTFLCGFLLSMAIEMHEALVDMNAWAGGVVPMRWASGWMFAARSTLNGSNR